MSKHTPGPWDKVVHGERDSRVGASTLIAIVYSTAFRDRENQEANAHLIAAAPDLLEALKSIRCTDCRDGVLLSDSFLFDLDREDERQPCPNCGPRFIAISKAEGASQKEGEF
jgi:DNA-directed RNA polymerase subunit RPC12/RpoP